MINEIMNQNSTFMQEILENVTKRVAPTWSLKNAIAVNPFLGLADKTFEEASMLLHKTAGINTTMSLSYYMDRVSAHEIKTKHLAEALDFLGLDHIDVNALRSAGSRFASNELEQKANKVPTFMDMASNGHLNDWSSYVIEKVSFWSASYFKDKEIKTIPGSSCNLFNAWRQEALIDKSFNIKGHRNYHQNLQALPNDPKELIQKVLNTLNLNSEEAEIYLLTLLMKVYGWSSYIAGVDWNNNLYGGNTDHLKEFIAVLLAIDFSFHQEGFASKLKGQIKSIGDQTKQLNYLHIKMIMQTAYDISAQESLIEKFDDADVRNDERAETKVQAVFCIDVRSEPFRRHLEETDPTVDTIGFAGFFGFPVQYKPLNYSSGKNQCPALIPSNFKVKESYTDLKLYEKAMKQRTLKHQFLRVWKSFKSQPISSFSFVSPLGISYLFKLVTDSMGWTNPSVDNEESGHSKNTEKTINIDHISLAEKAQTAASALKGMGLDRNLAPLVLLAGHKAESVNNPHATGLDCGACGGHSGEINALTAATVLNDVEVRQKLEDDHGISVPKDTHFVAGLHNTTTDEFTILNTSATPGSHKALLEKLTQNLKRAGKKTRQERSKRFDLENGDIDKLISQRSKDWSQVRPEWGLAGCNAIVIAPRAMTKEVNLEGRSFLHSYNWKEDEGYALLESIMAAPMVVSSWINLYYYGSTVDNTRLGAGNKTLHNVTAGLGVLEGSSGDLKVGLPWQSIHDGTRFQHLPQRLNVFINAPTSAINQVLAKHPELQNLFDNQWIYLFSLNEDAKVESQYVGDQSWKNIKTKKHTPETVEKQELELV
ncbi:DUF2309 domain-containing protein [bacterium]|nr:DUF2309 domain-containing protein [bacterium]